MSSALLWIVTLLYQAATLAQTGTTVSGRVTPAPGPRLSSLGIVQVVMVPNAPLAPLRAVVSSDGSFEFSRVPPDTYTLRVLPETSRVSSNRLPIRVTVGAQSVSGLELQGPQLLLGRAVIEGGGELPVSAAGLAATFGMTPISPSLIAVETSGPGGLFQYTVRADGYLWIPLAGDGEYGIAPVNLPFGYFPKSISYGGVDLRGSPLRIFGVPSSEILVTLTTVPADSVARATVKGRVTEIPGIVSPDSLVAILRGTGADRRSAESRIGPDGSFTFRAIPEGSYAVYLWGPGVDVVSSLTLSVSGQDLDGIEIPFVLRSTIKGQAIVLGRDGRRLPFDVSKPMRLSFAAPGSRPMVSEDLFDDGVFEMWLLEGEYDVTFETLPEGYTVKSISSRGADLLTGPLRIDRNTISGSIEVTLEYTAGAR